MNNYSNCSGCGNGCGYGSGAASLADSIMNDMKQHAMGTSSHQEDYLSQTGYQSSAANAGYHSLANEEQRAEVKVNHTPTEAERKFYEAKGQSNLDSAVRQAAQNQMPGFPESQKGDHLAEKKRGNTIDDAIAKASETSDKVIFVS